MGCVGSSVPVAFFKVKQQPQLYGMHALHRQFKIMQRVINIMKEERKKKKDNKKAS